jgi:AraC-like DNA-binding protein
MKRTNSRRLIVLEKVRLGGLSELEEPYDLETPLRWPEMDEAVRTAPPSAVVLVDPYADGRAGEQFPRLHDLLRRFPSLTVVAALQLRTESVGDVMTLMEWGVSEVIDLETEATPRAIRARLRQAHARPLKKRLEATLSPYVPPDARNLLLGAAEVAVEGGSAADLAELLRLSPRALAGLCSRADLPPPRQVQAWMRILLACMLLDDPGRTVYSAAFACGYSTDRSLRRAVQALLGTDTTTLRRGSAFTTAARGFNDLLLELREAGRERRRAARVASGT